MGMLNWIKWAIIGVITVIGVYVHISLVNSAVESNNAKWNKEQQELIKKNDETEKAILTGVLKLEEMKNEEIQNLNTTANDLRSKLRNRPSRKYITVYRDNPSIERACTGAELYREDGEFLIGEAARAERVLIERNYYYEQYEQVRKKLDERNKSK
jgi:hypothetical protein